MPPEPAEILIRGTREAPSGTRRRLLLDVDGREGWATLDMGLLARAEVAASDRVRDLLEMAAWIQAADAMVSRGDLTASGAAGGGDCILICRSAIPTSGTRPGSARN